MLYSPLELSDEIRGIVVDGLKRKYYRFRASKFYGGISTADCVGCNLKCVYCWSRNVRDKPQREYLGFLSPETVALRLIRIARKKGYRLLRISGNEPTISPSHLLKVLSELSSLITHETFVLETNGILIDEKLAKQLSQFNFIHVRVSLKACTPKHFSLVTGASGEGFRYQIKALENLLNNGVKCHPAILYELTSPNLLQKLGSELSKLNMNWMDWLEFEYYMPYAGTRVLAEKVFKAIKLDDKPTSS